MVFQLDNMILSYMPCFYLYLYYSNTCTYQTSSNIIVVSSNQISFKLKMLPATETNLINVDQMKGCINLENAIYLHCITIIKLIYSNH